jgi:hypothetical protein
MVISHHVVSRGSTFSLDMNRETSLNEAARLAWFLANSTVIVESRLSSRNKGPCLINFLQILFTSHLIFFLNSLSSELVLGCMAVTIFRRIRAGFPAAT